MSRSYCPKCGRRVQYTAGVYRCTEGHESYSNPIPVVMVIVPVLTATKFEGVILVERGIAPHRGGLALPGGYVDCGESWQEACVREVKEETGLKIKLGKLKLVFLVSSSDRNRLLVFAESQPVTNQAVSKFVPNKEVSALKLVKRAVPLSFKEQTEALRTWFTQYREFAYS